MDAEILEASRVLGKFLSDRNLTATTAESCTGGGIACAITAVSGSSGWFNQAYVTYSNGAKQKLVGVSAETLERHGAVSRETVREMAAGARKAAGADVAVSVSGIAGPTGGTAEKPVGSVWFGFAAGSHVLTEFRHFAGDRDSVRRQAVLFALRRLYAAASQEF